MYMGEKIIINLVKWLPKHPCPHSVFFLTASAFFHLFLMRREHKRKHVAAWRKALHPASLCCIFLMQPFLAIQVENIWSFLKTAGVITLQATNYILDEVQLISHHPGNQENGGEALSVLSFVFQKLIIITQTEIGHHVTWACCSVFCHSFEFPTEEMKKDFHCRVHCPKTCRKQK